MGRVPGWVVTRPGIQSSVVSAKAGYVKNLIDHLAGPRRSQYTWLLKFKMLLKSNPPFALWSIRVYLPVAQKLFLLVLCVVAVYSLLSAIVVMGRLRAMTIRPQIEDISSIQRSMAALHKRCANVHQLTSATFYLFGLVLFLGLQGAYFVLGLSGTPVVSIIVENFVLHFAFAANVFLVFLILHLIQWFVSSRVYACAQDSNTYDVA